MDDWSSLSSNVNDMSWMGHPNRTMPAGQGLMDRPLLVRNDATWEESEASQQGQSSGVSPASSVSDGSTETPPDGSSAPTMVHSGSSTCTDTWSIGLAEQDEADNEMSWEQGSDDVLTVPKLEPGEGEIAMGDIKAAPQATTQQADGQAAPQAKQKRPRGRPRKHPLNPVLSASKITKGRSKTGCITCRCVLLLR